MEKEIITQEKLTEVLNQSGHHGDFQIIGIDDSFGFTCKQCGSCCMNREDIIINPFDVYNGAKSLGIDPKEFLKRYTYGTIGGTSKIPIILLRTQENGYCPLLEFDAKNGGVFKCKIQEAKPGACANHPIGVLYQKDAKSKVSAVQYIKVDQCPNSTSTEMHIVRDWVKRQIDHMEEISLAYEMQGIIIEYFDPSRFYSLMNSVINTFALTDILALITQDDEESDEKADFLKSAKKINEDANSLLEGYIAAVYALYNTYDINKPFIPQATENIKNMRQYLEMIKDIYEIFKEILGKIFGTNVDEILKKLEEEDKENAK